MFNFPECNTSYRKTDEGPFINCDGRLLPLTTHGPGLNRHHTGIPLIIGAWKCSKCNRVIKL